MTDRAAPSNWMLALLASAQLIIALDATIVFVALPEISRALDFSAQRLQWVVSAYTVAFGGFLLLGGRATDLLGRRRMYVLGQSLYALASLAGGLAQSELPLILARAVQGLGGALLFPATLALIGNHFAEGPARNRALAIWSIASAFGLALGSALGGALTELFGWASIFLVNVPLAGAAALLALRLIPADARRQRGRRFDLAGALTVTAGATLLVFALVQGPESGWDAPSVRFGLYLSVPLLLAFLAIEHYSRDPLMPLRLLGNRNLQVAMLLTAIFMSSYGVQYYFLPSTSSRCTATACCRPAWRSSRRLCSVPSVSASPSACWPATGHARRWSPACCWAHSGSACWQRACRWGAASWRCCRPS